jgi:mannose-6-phosphate isomerase-like protein (cupin superfamily)
MHRPSRKLRPIRIAIVLGTSLGSCAAWAAEPVHPVKISKTQVAGAIFDDYEPVVKTEGGNTTHDVEVFLSKDRQFDAGMYRSGKLRALAAGALARITRMDRSGKVRAEIKTPYGVNEYMHFLDGGVTLTSSDGTVTEVRAGDSVVIPADWTGVWDTNGYTKIYVIYSPGGPIEE